MGEEPEVMLSMGGALVSRASLEASAFILPLLQCCFGAEKTSLRFDRRNDRRKSIVGSRLRRWYTRKPVLTAKKKFSLSSSTVAAQRRQTLTDFMTARRVVMILIFPGVERCETRSMGRFRLMASASVEKQKRAAILRLHLNPTHPEAISRKGIFAPLLLYAKQVTTSPSPRTPFSRDGGLSKACLVAKGKEYEVL